MKHTQESKQKMSLARLGKKRLPFSVEWKRKIGEKTRIRNMGHVPSLATRQKISIIHKGKHFSPRTEFKKGVLQLEKRKRVKITCKICGRPFEVKKSHSEKRINCSKVCFAKSQSLKIGQKNGNWMGGKSFESYSIDWTETLKRSIRERDNYTCGICHSQPEILCVHHIDYDKKNCNPNNLITLCNSCHSKTNKNRDYWVNYFNKQT